MATTTTKPRPKSRAPRLNGPGVPKAPPPILNLDDLTEPGATWAHAGVEYAYVRWSGLNMLERNGINKLHQRIGELEEIDEPTAEDAETWAATIRELVVLSTPTAPIDVVDGMTPEQRENICSYFLALRRARTSELQDRKIMSIADWLTATNPTPAPTMPSTTPATSSPDSIGSGRRATRASGSKSPGASSPATSERS